MDMGTRTAPGISSYVFNFRIIGNGPGNGGSHNQTVIFRTNANAVSSSNITVDIGRGIPVDMIVSDGRSNACRRIASGNYAGNINIVACIQGIYGNITAACQASNVIGGNISLSDVGVNLVFYPKHTHSTVNGNGFRGTAGGQHAHVDTLVVSINIYLTGSNAAFDCAIFYVRICNVGFGNILLTHRQGSTAQGCALAGSAPHIRLKHQLRAFPNSSNRQHIDRRSNITAKIHSSNISKRVNI